MALGAMFGIRERICFELSKRMIKPAPPRHESFEVYDQWRRDELSGQWRYFSNDDIRGKDVVDFGCGAGDLSFIVAEHEPRSIHGIETDPEVLARARAALAAWNHPARERISFMLGQTDRMPLPDRSHDTLLAFDCLEHIMEPLPIMREWRRVLRPGGKILIWWSPYKSPYGPHLEALVPIPWAHVIFGERAILRAAERIYDLEAFEPRPWHLAEDGTRKPNPLAGLNSFAQQGYLNQLDVKKFFAVVKEAGLEVSRLDAHTFSGTPVRKAIGEALVRLPVVGEYMTSYYIIELRA